MDGAAPCAFGGRLNVRNPLRVDQYSADRRLCGRRGSARREERLGLFRSILGRDGGNLRNARRRSDVRWKTDGKGVAGVVCVPGRFDDAHGAANLGNIQFHPVGEFDFQKQEERLGRRVPCGSLGGRLFFPLRTPTLIALLAIIAGKGNLLWGILLMFLYSMGHSILVLTAGVAVGFVQKINGSERYKTAARVSKAVMGTVILLVGLYMFWLAF